MKKLLIFHPQSLFSADDLENYLYDSEALRDDYLDMSPLKAFQGALSQTKYHYSEWDVALKADDDKYDQWHVVWAGDDQFVFDDPYLKQIGEFQNTLRMGRGRCMAAWHRPKVTYAIYKVQKELSGRTTEHLADLLESIDKGAYCDFVADSFGLGMEYIKDAPLL